MATLPPTLQTLSPNCCPTWGVTLEVFISPILIPPRPPRAPPCARAPTRTRMSSCPSGGRTCARSATTTSGTTRSRRGWGATGPRGPRAWPARGSPSCPTTWRGWSGRWRSTCWTRTWRTGTRRWPCRTSWGAPCWRARGSCRSSRMTCSRSGPATATTLWPQRRGPHGCPRLLFSCVFGADPIERSG